MPASGSFGGVEFTGRHAEYTGADTWYPSWAADGNLYSPFTDGMVYGLRSASYGPEFTTGHAKITGDEIHMIRVTPGIANMNERSQYEFYAGNDGNGAPIWSADFSAIKPVAKWRDNMGCVTMTYNAPLKRYFMCVTDGGNTFGYFNTYILESAGITGQWKLVTYMKRFGEQGYFVNIPSKFISADGRTMWLCHSANFGDEVNGVKQNRPGHGGEAGLQRWHHDQDGRVAG
ncbi:MAG: hypothetical protein MUF04_03720 [Akkermansiaceae bacterium]|nr:hypothetical protein [Akkermansiaceae bacterium]